MSVLFRISMDKSSLRWRHNDHAGVSNHQPHGCLLNRLFRRNSKKTSKLRVTGLCAGNSPGTGEFPAQMASYAENVFIWWRHHVIEKNNETTLNNRRKMKWIRNKMGYITERKNNKAKLRVCFMGYIHWKSCCQSEVPGRERPRFCKSGMLSDLFLTKKKGLQAVHTFGETFAKWLCFNGPSRKSFYVLFLIYSIGVHECISNAMFVYDHDIIYAMVQGIGTTNGVFLWCHELSWAVNNTIICHNYHHSVDRGAGLRSYCLLQIQPFFV